MQPKCQIAAIGNKGASPPAPPPEKATQMQWFAALPSPRACFLGSTGIAHAAAGHFFDPPIKVSRDP
uniref:Uncharacterized protein n=1 Tax=Citrifermentans bremense TaxID=60035 RepID=A0A6S6M5K6_9BACT